jgi:hypothetical protein
MAVATGTALAIGAGVSALGVGASVYQGERASSAAKKGRRLQEEAQQQAVAAAVSERRRGDEAARAANRRSPDMDSLLLGEQDANKLGVASTMLTGPRGVSLEDMRLRLGRPSLLGE